MLDLGPIRATEDPSLVPWRTVLGRAAERVMHLRRSGGLIQTVDSRQLHQQAAGQRPLFASRLHIKIFINIAAEFLDVCGRSSLLRIADGCGQTQ